MILISENWRSSHPGGALGILKMEIDAPLKDSTELDQKRVLLENQLRQQYQGISRAEIRKLPVMNGYTQYYKRFKKTYHLLLQLDSVCNKNKPIPQVDALVQAMFMAELNSFILTAGHDLDKIQGSIKLDSANGMEVYYNLRGDAVTCKSGDMVMSDNQSVICSVIYGQDQRTRITRDTRNVLYVMYVPPEIEPRVIEEHILDLEENIQLVAPLSQTKLSQIYFANSPNPSTIREN